MQEARALLSTFSSFLYFPLTTFLSIASGLLVWFGFFVVGLVARRYEAAFGRKTRWQFLVLAPSGILVYAVWQGLAYSIRGSLTTVEQWINYTLVFVSGLLCLWGAYIFRRVAEQVMRGAE